MAKKEKQIEKAQKFVLKGYFDKAIAEYKSIVAADPTDISLRLRLGELYVKTGLKEEAIKEYSSIGKYNTTKGFYLKAIAIYKLVIKLDEANLDIHNKLADLYTKQRLIADAIGEYSFILNLYEKKGYSNESFDLLKKMVSIDEENAGLKLRLADMQKKLGYEDDALDLYCWVFKRFLSKGQTEKAENLLRDLYADHPRDMRVLEGLVSINKERGDVSQFVSHASELIDSYKECGELEKIEALCESVLEVAPDNEKAKSMLDGLRGEVQSGHEDTSDEDEEEEALEGEVLEDSEVDVVAPEQGEAAQEPSQEASLEGAGAGKEEQAPEVEEVAEQEGASDEEQDVSQESPQVEEASAEETTKEVDIDLDIESDDESEQSGESEEVFDVDFDDFDDEEDEEASQPEEVDAEIDGESLSDVELPQSSDEAVEEEVLPEAALQVEDTEPEVDPEPEFELESDIEPESESKLESEPESVETEQEPEPTEEEETASEVALDVGIEEDSEQDVEVASAEEDLSKIEEIDIDEVEEVEVEEELSTPEILEDIEVEEVVEDLDEDAEVVESGDIEEVALEGDVTLEENDEEEEVVEAIDLEEVEIEEVLEGDSDVEFEEITPDDIEEVSDFASQSDLEDVGGAATAARPEQEFSEEEVSLSGDYTDESLAKDNAEAGEAPDGDGLIDLTDELGIEEALGQLVDSWSDSDSGDAVVEEFKVGMGEQLNREDVETHFNLGIAYMEMELFGDALREFKLSAKDRVFEFNSYARLGQCSVALEKAVDAVGFYIKALAVKGMSDTERIGAMYELALAYGQAGENSEALQMMTAVNNLDSGYREVSEKLVEFAIVRNYIPINDNLIEIELL
jgi:tetratricopeptide (TPR) repeat protein